MDAAGKKKQGWIARMLSEYISGVKKNPIAFGVPATALGLETGLFAWEDMIEPIVEPMAGGILGGQRLVEAGMQEMAGAHTIKMVEERSKQARESIRRNIQVIAQTNPQLYNELVAGKRLPRGAIVLGGPPRRDLLEEVATMMAGV
jgi:hypothetical protein